MGQTLRFRNFDDCRVHNSGRSGFGSRGEIDKDTKGEIEQGTASSSLWRDHPDHENWFSNGIGSITRLVILVLISLSRGSIFLSTMGNLPVPFFLFLRGF